MNRINYYFSRFLCYALSVALAFTIAGCCIFSVFSLTSANKRYTNDYFVSDQVTQELSADIYNKLEDVAESHGLEGEAIKKAYSYDFLKSVQSTALNTLYSGGPATVSDSTNIELYCKRALDDYNAKQNKAEKLSQEEIKTIISEVKAAFNSVYEITNSQDFYSFSVFFGRSVQLSVILAILSAAIGTAVYFLSGRRHRSLNFSAMSLMSAGGICVAIPVTTMLLFDLSNIKLTNIDAYNSAIEQSTSRIANTIIIVGVVLIAISITIFVSNYKYYSFKLKNSETEYEIEHNLI
ncbi:MAG: hypothetical protein PUE08_05880 [Eubacteriales bacterium]|nr:hypothetical protein [Eubacteriales bacterium]